MSVRQLLGVRLREEGKGLGGGSQILGNALYSAVIFGFTWVAASALGPYGGALGAAFGLATGHYLVAALFRANRARQQAHN